MQDERSLIGELFALIMAHPITVRSLASFINFLSICILGQREVQIINQEERQVGEVAQVENKN